MSEQYPGGPSPAGQPQQPSGAPQPPPPPGGYQAPPPPAGQQAPYAQQPPYGQQQPPYAQQAPSYSQVGQPADLGTRVLARLIDFVLLGVVTGIIYFIFSLFAVRNIWTGQVSFWPFAVSSLLSAVISLGYFVLMESSRGQTVGKMLLKVKTFGPDGALPTTEQAVKRNAWTALNVLGVIPVVGSTLGGLLMLGAVIYILVTINNNTASRQGWHDTFAGGTTVIKVG